MSEEAKALFLKLSAAHIEASGFHCSKPPHPDDEDEKKKKKPDPYCGA